MSQLDLPPPKKHTKTHPRTKKRLKDAPPIPLVMEGLCHDGRAVARYEADQDASKAGKKVFVSFALPGERALVKRTNSKNNFEEGDAICLIDAPNPQRVAPPCAHFGQCGGCALQHWSPQGQITHKQTVLCELLSHHANISPDVWLPPLTGASLHYRTKARMGVRYVAKKGGVLVGFRERKSNFLADIDTCPIMDTRLSNKIEALKALIGTLEARDAIAQLEIAMGETLPHMPASAKSVAIIMRHLVPLEAADLVRLQTFFEAQNWQLYLQGGGSDSVHRFDAPSDTPPTGGLFYHLPEFELVYEFSPQDFTQVNLDINRQMLKRAMELLDLKEGERVLDLFCGLGNFSLPMAKTIGPNGALVGVEGSAQMTQRATKNARTNGLTNCNFYAKDLTQDCSDEPWVGSGFDALLIDPPRTGALEMMAYLPKFGASRILYISCNPITLARDSAHLVAHGYRLTHACVMDMFCHTGHVESMALFVRQD